MNDQLTKRSPALGARATPAGPHQGQPVATAGEPLRSASVAMILLHGRGATAQSILELSRVLPQKGFAFLAPQAAGSTWYPNRFTARIGDNEPFLSSALTLVDAVVRSVNDAGIPPERMMLLGFSQGACLALEYAARHAMRYGGVIGLSGGLIGPSVSAPVEGGSLNNTPVFLGCSDTDPHIPRERVEETAEIMKRRGGDVTMRLYPNMEHTVSFEELTIVRQMMNNLLGL